MQLQSFIYCKNFKITTKSNPNDDALQFMLLIAENIIQIIFLILSLSVNSWRRARARVLASFKHTPHLKHGMSQSVTNAGESQWAFDYHAVKPVV